MKKTIRLLYGIAGGLVLVAGVLLLFLIVGSRIPGQSLTVGQEEHREKELLAQIMDQEADTEPGQAAETEAEPEPVPELETVPEQGQVSESETVPESDTDPVSDQNTEQDQDPADTAWEVPDPFTGFTMTIVGDTYYNQRRVDQYQQNGIRGLLDDTLISLMQEADVAVLNNECALSDGGTPMEDKQYTYQMTPSLTQSYVEMGIDLVTLANNHALDFGTEALTDTFETLDSYGIDYIGAGEDLERASEAAVYEIDGRTVAVLAASRVIPVVEWNVVNRQPGMFCTYDSTALEAEIAECREQYDYVVVYVHWGVMETEQPQDYQREMAKRYIDAGADVVLGTHPHVVQSIEFYRGKPIYYSLGNFLYGSSIQRTMLVALEVDAEGTLQSRIYPCCAENGRTRCMTEEQGQEFYRYMESISWAVAIDDMGYVKESENGRSEE